MGSRPVHGGTRDCGGIDPGPSRGRSADDARGLPGIAVGLARPGSRCRRSWSPERPRLPCRPGIQDRRHHGPYVTGRRDRAHSIHHRQRRVRAKRRHGSERGCSADRRWGANGDLGRDSRRGRSRGRDGRHRIGRQGSCRRRLGPILRGLRSVRFERRHGRWRGYRRDVLQIRAFVPGGRQLMRQTRRIEGRSADQWKAGVGAGRQEDLLLVRVRRARIEERAGSVGHGERVRIVRVRERSCQVRNLDPGRENRCMWSLSGCRRSRLQGECRGRPIAVRDEPRCARGEQREGREAGNRDRNAGCQRVTGPHDRESPGHADRLQVADKDGTTL